MSVNDPISDMLTRIRNAVRIRAKSTNCLNSRVCRGIADVLKHEGYIDGYDLVEDGRSGKIKVKLRFGPGGEPVIHTIRRESKPGRRIYKGVDDLPRPLQGLGICVVSTSKGVMSDRQARTARIGGELLAVIE